MCRSRLHPNVGRRLPSEQHVGTTDRYGPCRHRHATRFRIHLLQSGSYGFPKVAVRLLGRHDRYHLKCALPKSADRRERLQSRSRREIAELRHTIACLFQLQTLRALGRRSGFYTPDGSSVDWGDDWSGAHLIQNISLAAYTFQPTVSFKICDRLSIGAGMTITWGNFDCRGRCFRRCPSRTSWVA